MGAKIGVLLNCGQQSQFSKVRREFDAGRVNLDPPMTCADWPVPGNLTLLHPQTAYTRKPLHRNGSLVTPVPLTTDRTVALSRMLRIESCSCMTGWRKAHGCRKAVVYCSPKYSPVMLEHAATGMQSWYRRRPIEVWVRQLLTCRTKCFEHC